MRKFSFIGLLLLAALLWACRRTAPATKLSDTAQGRMTIAVEFPECPVSKADYYRAESEENKITSLCLWVFDKDGKLFPHSPLNIDASEFPEGGGVKEFSFPVDWSFVLNPSTVHVYALANAQSIGFDLTHPEELKMADLDAAAFGGNYFGTSSLTCSVPATGLPMSAVMHCVPSGSSPVLRVETLTLSRMVSRIRMVFCKTLTTGEGTPEVSIDRIIFNGKTIPNEEYLFTTGDTGIKRADTEVDDNNYVLDQIVFPWPGGMALCDNEAPESLIYVNQDPKSYNEMLDKAVEDNCLTDLGYIYLRESDRKLKGHIKYTVNGVERSRDFFMEAGNDFARNHTWTLLAYFLSGRNLQIMLMVLPWDMTERSVDFSKLAVNVTQKFTLDENTVDLTLTSKDHYDAVLLPGVAAHGWLQITTPVGGTLYVEPIGGTSYFTVSTNKDTQEDTITINPDEEGGKVHIYIRPSEMALRPDDVGTVEAAILLSFSVEVNDRWIDANTEAINAEYRFIRQQ